MTSEGSNSGSFAKIGHWLDDHWRATIPVGGAGIMAVATHFLAKEGSSSYLWLVFMVGVLVTAFGAVLSVRHSNRLSRVKLELENARDPSRVFLLVSAFAEDWQVELEHQLVVQLGRKGYRATLFAPSHDYSATEQDDHFRDVLNRSADYVGGIVIPIEPESRKAELLKFAHEFQKPIVFVDNAPFGESECPDNATFVGVSSTLGGFLAAVALENALGTDKQACTILVVAAITQVARQNEIKARLAQSRPTWKLEIDPGGMFDREQARTLVDRRLRNSDQTRVDAIVCTSDAMTLGCLDAIRGLNENEAPQVVIGYDGIAVTRGLVNNSSSPLRRVVVQDTHEIAVACATALSDLLQGITPSDFRLIRPYLYPIVHDLGSGPPASAARTIITAHRDD